MSALLEDLELYVQETGQGGRDGAPITATFFYKKADLSGTCLITEGVCTYITQIYRTAVIMF